MILAANIILALVLAVTGCAVYKFLKMVIQYRLKTNKYRELLQQSQDIENISSKSQRAVATAKWCAERDGLLRKTWMQEILEQTD